jgi:hypothetical protein
MKIGIVTSSTYAGTLLKSNFEAGVGAGVQFALYEAGGKYDDGGGAGSSHQELYAAVKQFDADVTVDVIVAVGGLVSAHAALEKCITTPFLVLVGQMPPDFDLSSNGNFRGGVNLQMPDQNAARHDFLVGYYKVRPDLISLLWNSNSKMGKREQKSWVIDNGWPLDEMVLANDPTTYATHFANIVASGAKALVISADPYFTSTDGPLVQAANTTNLFVCYPFSLYANTHPAHNRSMWYGPDLGLAYNTLGKMARNLLTNPKTSIGISVLTPNGPTYL